jgi:hypothetical protein
MVWAAFWAIFQQTHMVILVVIAESLQRNSTNISNCHLRVFSECVHGF